MTEVRAFKLEAFEAEGQGFVGAARAEARRLLSAVLAERDRIRATAREEARAAGREEGLRQGREEAAGEIARLTAMLKEAAAGLSARRDEMAAESEGDLVRLAVSIAERIIKIEVRGRAWDIAEANLKRAMALAVRCREIVVRVHPGDLEALKDRLPDLEGVTFRADPAVSRGGCAIDTEKGGVDADLATQLGEIERGLLG